MRVRQATNLCDAQIWVVRRVTIRRRRIIRVSNRGHHFHRALRGDPSPPGLGSCALGSPLRPGSTAWTLPLRSRRAAEGARPRASGSRAAPLRTARARARKGLRRG